MSRQTDKYQFIKLKEGNSYIEIFNEIPECYRLDEKEFERLWNIHPDEKGKVKIMGKEIETPRWQHSYGVPYNFSGMVHEALPLVDPFLLKLQWMVEKYSDKKYAQCLINWYQDGTHYIGKHSDDEKQLVPGTNIYSFSFGPEGERDIIFKSKKTDEKHKIFMPHNSLLVMGGETNKYYTHEVPKRANKGKRINVTFRCFKES